MNSKTNVDCSYLLVHEVSMLDAAVMERLNANLSAVKGNDLNLFGGINLLFLGICSSQQLRPLEG